MYAILHTNSGYGKRNTLAASTLSISCRFVTSLGTAYPTCSDILHSTKQSSEPELAGLFLPKHGMILCSKLCFELWKMSMQLEQAVS